MMTSALPAVKTPIEIAKQAPAPIIVPTEHTMLAMFKTEKYQNLSIPVLKEWLGTKGIKV